MKREPITYPAGTPPAIDLLRALFSYNELTGELTHLVNRGRARAGTPATTNCGDGYLSVKAPGFDPLLAHRVAWALNHGEWPTLLVDHRDRNRKNNAISNLRHATYRENSQNRIVPARNNLSGLIGASFHPASGLWRSRIKVDGREMTTYHQTAEAAHAEYMRVKVVAHPSFVHGALA